MMAEPDRPSPEAFLRAAAQEGRGRLKLFLGAAPGVGKTYEMLRQAAARRDAGVDVVIGLIETHGRAETEALTVGLELLPRRTILHENRHFTEMDLDAILSRRPQLVLIDELAHSNAPTSRHAKRWQDVAELIDAGIDVYSTVNVQHVESLNDVVASFTKVRVRETLPDSVLDDAEIELIDIPPDELIERLRDGKVYIPAEASRALDHFFSKSNLSALRELALRRAAQTVDAQMLDYLRAHAMAGTYAGGERILVAVSEQPGADALIRSARRLADALRAPWIALHVETSRNARFTPSEQERLAQAMGLAATLGATLMTIPAATVVGGLLDQLAEQRVTQLIIGKSARNWWFERRHPSIVDRIVRRSEDLAVYVLPLGRGNGRDNGPAHKQHRARPAERPLNYAMSLAFVALMAALGKLIEPLIGYRSIDLLFLIPTVAAATLLGLRQGVIAGIGSALAYNFLFVPPLHSFTIYDPQNVITFFVLTATAVISSQFAGRVRAQADLGARSARENAAIAGFARRLGALSTQQETAQTVCAEVAKLLDVQAILLVEDAGALHTLACFPTDSGLTAVDRAAAGWTWTHAEPTGRGTGTLAASEWRFHPLTTALGTLAVLGIAKADATDPLPPHRASLFMSLVDQAALAHERLKLEADMRDMAALKERDALRATLLSSIAHDLRTPLTAVTAGVEALRSDSGNPQLLSTISTEARRLGRFFDNLIDVTRIEAGAIVPRLEPTDLTDAVAAAIHDVRSAQEDRSVRLDVPPSLPLVRTDPNLLHHILINLIDNAVKFSAPASEIRLEGRREPDGLTLSILDEGRGLAQGHERDIFDTFTRIEGSDRTGGTGLGLAIVKGFATAMGISAKAENRTDRSGARFTLYFPDNLLLRPREDQA